MAHFGDGDDHADVAPDLSNVIWAPPVLRTEDQSNHEGYGASERWLGEIVSGLLTIWPLAGQLFQELSIWQHVVGLRKFLEWGCKSFAMSLSSSFNGLAAAVGSSPQMSAREVHHFNGFPLHELVLSLLRIILGKWPSLVSMPPFLLAFRPG